MKKIFTLCIGVLLFASCEQDTIVPEIEEVKVDQSSFAKKGDKVDVCHKGEIINVSINSIPGHQGHGDAVDMDGDGYFDLDNLCSATDCDDTDAAINPGATEVIYDGIDNDCNPETLDDDLDKDGYNIDVDCDDTDPAVNPGATEVIYDGIDNDCNPETLDDDLDQDGFNIDVDCDDNNAEVNPAMEEVCDNGIDDNCNGEIDENCSDPCLDEAINMVSAEIQGLGGTNLSTTITGPKTFFIFWESNGRNGRGCIKTTAEATGDLETTCGFINRFHNNVPCS